MANVTIDVAAQFKGKPAFDKADSAVGGLEKSVTKLAKKFAALFAADKIIAFGKASAQAFMEDQKSAALLANTVNNLGLAFAQPEINGFIKRLEETTGVLDEQLRPALQKLLTTTGDVLKSQKLLAEAVDISRGSGVDLATVTQDLSNAYVGNTKGLKKYNLGLTAAQLKTASFADIQKKLNDQFKGSSAAYLKTYAGQMAILGVAADNTKESIGKGLLDSLALIAGDNSVQGLADSMKQLGDNTANVLYGFATMVTQLKNIGAAAPSWLQSILKSVNNVIYSQTIFSQLGKIAKVGEIAQNKKLQNPSVQMFMTDEANNRLNNQKVKLQKEQIKATKALTAEQKKQALLKKQSALFDMQQIELVAALKGKLSEEDQKRVELQLALLQGNETEAAKLTTEIANSIDKTGNLAKYLQTLPDANNPFKNWSSYLDSVEAQATRIAAMGSSVTAAAGASTNVGTGVTGGTSGLDYGGNQIGSPVQGFTPTVVVQFQGADSLSNALRDSFVSASMDGSFSQINRTVGAFDR